MILKGLASQATSSKPFTRKVFHYTPGVMLVKAKIPASNKPNRAIRRFGPTKRLLILEHQYILVSEAKQSLVIKNDDSEACVRYFQTYAID
jgi:hypothetical protein